MTQFVLANQTPQDGVGRTLPKSRLYFYENNTFNFKDVYSDTARTSVLPNPVIADGDGRFPAIYLAVNSNYRVSLKDRFDKQVTPFVDNQGGDALGLGTAAYADMVGTVSESGGIPTGAIFESGGSGSGGIYTKWLDGTLTIDGINYTSAITMINAGSISTGQLTIPLPAGCPNSTISWLVTGGGNSNLADGWITPDSIKSTTNLACRYFTPIQGAVTVTDLLLSARGRWY